jgi:hypothetical protein
MVKNALIHYELSSFVLSFAKTIRLRKKDRITVKPYYNIVEGTEKSSL